MTCHGCPFCQRSVGLSHGFEGRPNDFRAIYVCSQGSEIVRYPRGYEGEMKVPKPEWCPWKKNI